MSTVLISIRQITHLSAVVDDAHTALQTSLETLYLTRFISSHIGQGGKEVDLKNFQLAKNKALSVVETLLEQPDSVD